MHLECCQSRFHPERPQTAQDFFADLLVRLQSVNTHATYAIRIESRGHAGITDVSLTGIFHVQFAATVPTPQQTHKKRLSGTYSATYSVTTRHAVVRNQILNALIFLPIDVPFVMIGDQ